MLTRSVLCVGFLIVINGITGLEHEEFPGNSKWIDKLKKCLSMNNQDSLDWDDDDFWKNSDFPGSASWIRKFRKSFTRPCFRSGFPNPPDCKPISDPGFDYPEVNIFIFGDVKNAPKIEHKSLECSDPDYSKDSFFMLQTKVLRGGSSSLSSYFYNKDGEKISYFPKVKMVPINEKCPENYH